MENTVTPRNPYDEARVRVRNVAYGLGLSESQRTTINNFSDALSSGVPFDFYPQDVEILTKIEAALGLVQEQPSTERGVKTTRTPFLEAISRVQPHPDHTPTPIRLTSLTIPNVDLVAEVQTRSEGKFSRISLSIPNLPNTSQ